MDFELYEFNLYANAKMELHELETEYEEVLENIYDDIPYSRMVSDPAFGWTFKNENVEDVALSIICTKDYYEKKIEKLRNKAEMFDSVLNRLDKEDRDTLKKVYLFKEYVPYNKLKRAIRKAIKLLVVDIAEYKENKRVSRLTKIVRSSGF